MGHLLKSLASASILIACTAAAPALGASSSKGGGVQLIMFEQRGCEWCEVWKVATDRTRLYEP